MSVGRAPPFTAIIAALPDSVPFVGPEALERRSGRPLRARIGANESAFGPSPKAVAAMQDAAAESWMYGDPEMAALKAALAHAASVTPAHIAVGGGIDALLGLTVRLFVAPGGTVVASLGGYPTFAFHVAGYGGRLVTVPYRDDREDLEGLLAAAQRVRPTLVYLANPDNPMGTCWPGTAVAQMLAQLPGETLLCLDEAYGEFAPPGTLPAIDPAHPQVLRFRTFSKAHGLAGLRVGYAIGAPATIAAFDRIRDHFAIGRIAQAGAIASLADQAHLGTVVAEVVAARARLTAIAHSLGFAAVPSATNFVAIDLKRDGAFTRAVVDRLLQHGVFVRMPSVAPLDRCLRVSCGRPADLDRFAAALPQALAEAGR